MGTGSEAIDDTATGPDAEDLHPTYGLLFRSVVNLILLLLCISFLQFLLLKLSR